ncbi:hypothetical protein SK128_002914, partial [Halocaridina rubra]
MSSHAIKFVMEDCAAYNHIYQQHNMHSQIALCKAWDQQWSSSEPSAINLIIQFIYNSVKRTDTSNNEVEAVDISTPESSKKKESLSVLALKAAAHLNWDLD